MDSTHKIPADAGRHGFTLVELLVVIGIIALLISILLPSLNKARVQARLTVCQSNLRQNGLAIQMYANDNRGWYPQGVLFNFPFAALATAPQAESYFGNVLLPYTGRVVKTFYCPFQPYNLPASGGFFVGGTHYWAGYFYLGRYSYDLPTATARTVDNYFYSERMGDGPRTKLMQDWIDELAFNHEMPNSLYTDGSVSPERRSELVVRARAGGRPPRW